MADLCCLDRGHCCQQDRLHLVHHREDSKSPPVLRRADSKSRPVLRRAGSRSQLAHRLGGSRSLPVLHQGDWKNLLDPKTAYRGTQHLRHQPDLARGWVLQC